MKKNKITIISVTFVTVLAIVFGVVMGKSIYDNNSQQFYNGIPVGYSHASYMFDTSTPEKAIGVSDYVFIAQVNEIVRTEYKNPIETETSTKEKTIVTSPYTIYSITVFKNIKGDLLTSKPIEFMQYGGLNSDGQSYSLMEDSSLLNVGEYYLLMANTWEENGLIEVSEPTRIIALGKDFNINSKDAITTITKYEQAYKNQVVPSIKNGNSMNYEKGYTSKYDVNYKAN